MSCEQIRDAISARLDGEDTAVDAAVVAAHLSGCAPCRAFEVSAKAVHRSLRVAPAAPVPDLTQGILTAVGAEAGSRASRGRAVGLRAILVALALVQIGVAVPALLGSETGLPVHSARHLGSFGLALAVGFLFAAWRPTRIAGLLPVVAALVACLVGTSVLDVAAGRTAALSEAEHAAEVAGLLVAWLLTRPATTSTPRVAT